MSRPLGLTPKVAATVVAAVRAGRCIVDAAAGVGLAPSTVYDWISRGELYPRSMFGAFRRSVLDAKTRARRDRLARKTAARAAGTAAARRITPGATTRL